MSEDTDAARLRCSSISLEDGADEAWMRGEPNFGFVLRNADENLNAFTNKSCITRYTEPGLELTYY